MFVMPARSTKQKATEKTRIAARLSAIVLFVSLVTASVLGWRWVREIPLRSVEIDAGASVPADEVADLVQVDAARPLFQIPVDSIARRVERHPWVRRVSVTRIPNGVLRVSVDGREPVVLALDGAGRPAYYLDAAGRRMPLRKGAAHLVPLIRGLGPRSVTRDSVTAPVVRALLADLAAADEHVHAIVSEFMIRPGSQGIGLRTVPFGASGSVDVRLGKSGFSDRLARLAAFWDQAVLTRPETVIQSIDLRFDGQIVVRTRPE